jgi:hypothetical protein
MSSFKYELDWNALSGNKNAIDLLRKYPENINWTILSGNPNAFQLLIENPKKINWDYLSSNQNPNVISFFKRKSIKN